MKWAKTHFHAKYNLAGSGLTNYPLSELPVTLNDLELTGDSYYGYEPLQKTIGDIYNVSQDKIFFTLGTSFANFMVMAALFEPGDDIIIENPAYELLVSTAGYAGYEVKRFHRKFNEGFRVNPAAIRNEISANTKLIMLTNLHNPSSVFTDAATLKEIAGIAASVGAYVCVDEVYLDAASDVRPSSSIHLGDNFIVTSSLTKVYGISGLRAGWIFAQPELIRKMWHLSDLFYVKHVHLAERLGLIAFQNLDKIKARSRSILDRNHKLVNDFLSSRDDLEAHYPGFGTMIFPRLKKGSVDDLSLILTDKYDTAITPGRFFDMPDFFRIGLGCEPILFQEGLRRIESALEEL